MCRNASERVEGGRDMSRSGEVCPWWSACVHGATRESTHGESVIRFTSNLLKTACWGFWCVGRVARCVVGPDACAGGSMLAWWAHISGASVQRVRAVGARGEGRAPCIGGQGVAGHGRSGTGRVGSRGVAWGHNVTYGLISRRATVPSVSAGPWRGCGERRTGPEPVRLLDATSRGGGFACGLGGQLFTWGLACACDV